MLSLKCKLNLSIQEVGLGNNFDDVILENKKFVKWTGETTWLT